MWTLLSSSEMFPFTVSILFVAGLVGLELLSLLFGASLIGADADGPDVDVGAGIDADFDANLELEADLEAGAALDDAADAAGAGGAGGVLAWLGVGDAPFILWLAGVAASFGISGYVLQTVLNNSFGAMAPAAIAALLMLAPGLLGGKYFARLIGRLAPKTETTAVSRRHLGGRLGVITQGTAEEGRPAECRVTDRHGAFHYVRAVPREKGVKIQKGTDVIVFRPIDGIHPVIPFDAD